MQASQYDACVGMMGEVHLVQPGEAPLCVAGCYEHTLTADWLNDGSLGVLRQEACELHSSCMHHWCL